MLARVLRGVRAAWLWLARPPGPSDPAERRRWNAEMSRRRDSAMTEADRSNLAGGMRGGPGGEIFRG